MNKILSADNIFIDFPSLELIFEKIKNGITITDEHSTILYTNSDNIFYIAVFSDVSFLVKDIHHEMHLAFYDPLTELPNRRLYLDRVKKVIQGAKDNRDFVAAIMFMDLDKFKRVNDTYGHVIWDKLLKMVGQRIAALTRPCDTIARIGGDEFAGILVANCNKELADHIARGISDAIQVPFQIDGHDIQVSISIDVSLYPLNSTNFDVLIANADKAMYTAKKSGTKIAFYDSRRE